MSLTPHKCANCGKTFNPVLQVCPFCNTRRADAPAAPAKPVVPAAPPSTGALKTNYPDLADKFVAQFGNLLLLDYSLASITALDLFIAESWGREGAAPNDDQWDPGKKWGMIVAIGSYFGETLRRAWNGHWFEDPANECHPLWTMVRLPPSSGIMVISKVYKRFKNGAEDSLEPLLFSIQPKLSPRPQTPESWLKQIEFFRKINRPDLADPFYERLLLLTLSAEDRARYETERAECRAQAHAAAAIDFAKEEEKCFPALELAGVLVNHTPASLAAIDVWLYHYWGAEPLEKEGHPTYARDEWALGCYLGELFRLRCGGQWEENRDHPDCSHIIWPSGFRTCPFTYFSKRFENGAGHPVYGQFEYCRQLLAERGDMPPPGDESEEWLDQAEHEAQGFTGRIDVALQMAKKAIELNPQSARGHLLAAQWTLAADPTAALQYLETALSLGAPAIAGHRFKARLFRQQGDWNAQLEAARAILAEAPGEGEAKLLEAHALFDLGRHDEALPAFEAATGLEGAPRDVLAWFRLGDCLQAAGRLEEAIAAWKNAQNDEATWLEASWRIGEAEASLGRRGESRHAFRRLAESQTAPAEWKTAAAERILAIENDPRYLKEQADFLAKTGKTAEAVAQYARITEIEPGNAEAWRQQGIGLSMLNRLDEAFAAWDRAIAADPACAQYWEDKAVALGRAGKMAEGLAMLDQGLQALPEAASLWARRSFFAAKVSGDWQEALAAACRATEIDPQHDKGWLFRADAERRLGDVEAAKVSLRNFLAHVAAENVRGRQDVTRMLWQLEHPDKPVNPQLAAQLQDQAMQLLQAGRTEDGLVAFERAHEADPGSFEILNNFGSACMSLGRAAEALDCYERAVRLYPTFDMIQHNRAAALSNLGRDEEALAVYDELLARWPKHAETLEKKTMLLTRRQRHEEALATADRWIAAASNPLAARKQRAWLLSQMKRHEESLAEYERALKLAPQDRKLWLEKATTLADCGRREEADKLIAEAFKDEKFAEEYHQEGLKLLDQLTGPPQ